MKYDIGSVIGAYRLQACCGEGTYGTVFLAVHEKIGQQVALKLLHNTSESKRAQRELAGLQAVCNIHHPNLVPILHVDEVDGILYYTMPPADNAASSPGQYCADTLAERLEQHGRLEPVQIQTMILELLDGLAELHRLHLVHRDIKPANILYINGRPALGDIGLVTAQPDASLAGTPGFFRAEWLGGATLLDQRNDLYALGKVIYCALTGNRATMFPSWPEDLPLSEACSAMMRCCVAVCEADSSIDSIQKFRALFQAADGEEIPELPPCNRAWLELPIEYTPSQRRAIERKQAQTLAAFQEFSTKKAEEFFETNDCEAPDFSERYSAFIVQLQEEELFSHPEYQIYLLGKEIEQLRAVVESKDATEVEKQQAEAALKVKVPQWQELLKEF